MLAKEINSQTRFGMAAAVPPVGTVNPEPSGNETGMTNVVLALPDCVPRATMRWTPASKPAGTAKVTVGSVPSLCAVTVPRSIESE